MRRKMFGDDASTRRTTVVESIKAGKPIVGVEPGREALSIFGMTPVMHDGKTLANVDIGAAFGKEFVDRAKKRFGIDLAVHSFDGQSFKRLSSTFGDSVVATPDELKSVMNGAAVLRDAALDGHAVELYLGQIKNYAGEPVAVLEIIKDTSDYAAAAASAQRNLILGVVAILVAAILLAFLLGRGLSRPLIAITAVMNRLSSGDTGVTIPGSERRDELGTMAKAVDVFRRSMIETSPLREAQEADKVKAEADRRALQRQMADRFESDVKRHGRRGGAIVERHAARRRRDHVERQRHLGTDRGGSQRVGRGVGQRQCGCRSNRGTGVLDHRDPSNT